MRYLPLLLLLGFIGCPKKTSPKVIVQECPKRIACACPTLPEPKKCDRKNLIKQLYKSRLRGKEILELLRKERLFYDAECGEGLK